MYLLFIIIFSLFTTPPSVCGVFLKNYTLVRFADKSVKPQT